MPSPAASGWCCSFADRGAGTASSSYVHSNDPVGVSREQVSRWEHCQQTTRALRRISPRSTVLPTPSVTAPTYRRYPRQQEHSSALTRPTYRRPGLCLTRLATCLSASTLAEPSGSSYQTTSSSSSATWVRARCNFDRAAGALRRLGATNPTPQARRRQRHRARYYAPSSVASAASTDARVRSAPRRSRSVHSTSPHRSPLRRPQHTSARDMGQSTRDRYRAPEGAKGRASCTVPDPTAFPDRTQRSHSGRQKDQINGAFVGRTGLEPVTDGL
jgi:hypothetical protein